jgi:diguanylate cyclase (GGDEF)-like protein/PAS domain S-box-containing protein
VSAVLPKQALIEEREALQRSERRFRALIENSADGIVLTDAEGRLIYGSPGARRALGYALGETLGWHGDDLMHPQDRAAFEELLARVKGRPGVTHEVRARVRHRNGSYRLLEGTLTDLCADRSVGAIVFNFRDITERLESERQRRDAELHMTRLKTIYAALSVANEAILRAKSPQEMFRSACEIAVETGGFLLGTVFTLDPRSGLLARVAASGPVAAIPDELPPSVDPAHPGGQSLIGRACRSGEAQICNDYQNDPRTLGRRLLKRGYEVGAAAVYPLRVEGRPVGAFGVQHADKDVFTGELAALLQRLADNISFALESFEHISAQRAAEGKVQLNAQRNEGIARLGQFALDASDLDAVLAEAVRILRLGCDVATVVEQLGGESGFRVRAASGEGAETTVGASAAVNPDAMWRAAIERGAVLVCGREHFRSRSPHRPWSAWLRRMGSGVHVPIQGERAAFGVLTMNSLRDDAFDEDDLRFAEAVASALSGAVRRLQTQTRLAYMAEFDALTGLPNRNLLQDRLTQAVARAHRHGEQGAVLFIDLDRFKLINDTLGHHVGDALIAEVGVRLMQCVRSVDTVGRVSGDEFAVILSELARADDAALVAQKILGTLALPFDLEGTEAYITASIGISVFPADGEDAETLLKNADMAMYRAKEMTRNAYCFFTAEMNRRSVAKLQLNTDLRRAIERREFVLHYQPKVDLREGRLLGVETLLRWNHPQRGTVQPEEFIPALEDSGLILPVGEWVLQEACAQLRRWQAAGLRAVPVAVNLSAKQFLRPDLDAMVRRVLAAEGVAPELIELEITESCLMSDPQEAVRLLANLRAMGLKISVDDFGTGYSSLSYLTRLPLTALKIDHSFVRNAVSSREAASIVRAVIDMAHNLHFTVIAEGIETDEQVAFLRRHGCDLGQGYLFGRPMPADQMAVRLGRAA